jgi:heat shock protein HslJ
MNRVSLKTIVVVTLMFIAFSGNMAPAAVMDDEVSEFVSVGGYVAFRQRITMPPESVLSVRIEEVPHPDAQPILVSEVRGPLGTRRTPIPFSIKIVSSAINPRSNYFLSSDLTVNGVVRLTSTRNYPVLSPEAPGLINVLLDTAQPKTPQAITSMSQFEAKAPLFDTVWKLVELNGGDSIKFPSQKKEVTMSLSGEGSRLNGFGGCNTLTGIFTHAAASLRFTLSSGTGKTCDDALMDYERQVMKMLGAATNYRIEGHQLTLINSDDQIVARFDAIHS